MKIPNALEFDKILTRLAERTYSIPGSERAKRLVPSNDSDLVRTMMSQTMEAESLLARITYSPMRRFSSIDHELQRMNMQASLSAEELLRINHVMKAAKQAAPLAREEDAWQISAMAQELFFDDSFIRRVDQSILAKDEIADAASSELARIRRAINRENESVKSKLQSIIGSQKDNKYLQDSIITQRSGRYVVPVKAEHKNHVPGIVHEKSASGATFFIEPAGVVESNNRIRELESAEANEIERILQALTNHASAYQRELKRNVEQLTNLDLLFAKVALAKDMDAHPVEFNDKNILEIKEGRHPMIPSDEVVPVGISMGGSTTALVITGPNTGGKTVTLKLVGLFCAMAQAGLYLPAKPMIKLPVFDSIFVDIGDEQSIQQSLSTFSAHMKKIVYAVNYAKKNSLVLFDELGAGTDPQEGGAIAQAVLSHLHDRGCMLIATTHIGELKAFAAKEEGFENASMEFNPETLAPTYRLIMGVAGSSNALSISKSLGLPQPIINMAEGFMQSESIEYGKLLEEAERERKEAERKLERSEQLLEEARTERKRAQRAAKQTKAKRKRILQQANVKAGEILKDASTTAEQAIEKAKQMKVQPEPKRTKITQEVRDTISDKRAFIEKHKQIQTTQKTEKLRADQINKGDTVLIIPMDAPATVLSAPDKKGMVRLQAGMMQTELHYSKLAHTTQPSIAEQTPTPSRVDVSARRNIGMSLDLHGENVDNAEIMIDEYLDDAFLSGLNEVIIVHGIGTGVLKKGVRRHLKHHPHVASMRPGKYDEGGNGATVVTLK